MNKTIIPIILAAGNSKRFGTENKLLYNINNKSMIENTLKHFIGNFNDIIVVLGFDMEKISIFLQKVDFKGSNLHIVKNIDWNIKGMSSSVKKGVEYVLSNCITKGMLIHPGDIPFLQHEDIKRIISAVNRNNYDKIIIPKHQKNKGHPLYIPINLAHEVLKIDEDSEGLRGFLTKYKDLKIFTECSEGILRDIDTKLDVNK